MVVKHGSSQKLGFKNKLAINADLISEMEDGVNLIEVMESEYDMFFVDGHNGWKNTNCPFPEHQDGNPSFGANGETGWFNCFGCGEKGRLFSFIRRIEGLSYPEALHRLALLSGYNVDQDDSELYRSLREIGLTVDEYLKRHAETQLPAGMSEQQFLLSFASRLRKYELTVPKNSSEIAWIDAVYYTLDKAAEVEDHKKMSELWKDIGSMIKERKTKNETNA